MFRIIKNVTDNLPSELLQRKFSPRFSSFLRVFFAISYPAGIGLNWTGTLLMQTRKETATTDNIGDSRELHLNPVIMFAFFLGKACLL